MCSGRAAAGCRRLLVCAGRAGRGGSGSPGVRLGGGRVQPVRWEGLWRPGRRPFAAAVTGRGPCALSADRGAMHFCLWRPVRAADGCRRLFPTRLCPLEGRKTAPQGAERDMRARVGVVIWASGPKQGVGAAGECALEGLRGPQAGCGGGGRLGGGPRGPGLPVRRR